MKIYSTSIVTKEMQIKIRYHFLPPRVAIIKSN